MDIQVFDILQMKKTHPCGSDTWRTLRIGMDFKLRCEGCDHEIMLPRNKVEKNLIKIQREDQTIFQKK